MQHILKVYTFGICLESVQVAPPPHSMLSPSYATSLQLHDELYSNDAIQLYKYVIICF
jgi:hypothetical protein